MYKLTRETHLRLIGKVEQQSSTRHYPSRWLNRRLQLDCHNIIRRHARGGECALANRGFVRRAFVLVRVAVVVELGQEMNGREFYTGTNTAADRHR